MDLRVPQRPPEQHSCGGSARGRHGDVQPGWRYARVASRAPANHVPRNHKQVAARFARRAGPERSEDHAHRRSVLRIFTYLLRLTLDTAIARANLCYNKYVESAPGMPSETLPGHFQLTLTGGSPAFGTGEPDIRLMGEPIFGAPSLRMTAVPFR